MHAYMCMHRQWWVQEHSMTGERSLTLQVGLCVCIHLPHRHACRCVHLPHDQLRKLQQKLSTSRSSKPYCLGDGGVCLQLPGSRTCEMCARYMHSACVGLEGFQLQDGQSRRVCCHCPCRALFVLQPSLPHAFHASSCNC